MRPVFSAKDCVFLSWPRCIPLKPLLTLPSHPPIALREAYVYFPHVWTSYTHTHRLHTDTLQHTRLQLSIHKRMDCHTFIQKGPKKILLKHNPMTLFPYRDHIVSRWRGQESQLNQSKALFFSPPLYTLCKYTCSWAKGSGDKSCLSLSSTYNKMVLRWKEDYSFATHLRRLLGALLRLCVKSPFTKVLTSHGETPRQSERDANWAVGEYGLIVFR